MNNTTKKLVRRKVKYTNLNDHWKYLSQDKNELQEPKKTFKNLITDWSKVQGLKKISRDLGQSRNYL
jgi:hypothetical protein